MKIVNIILIGNGFDDTKPLKVKIGANTTANDILRAIKVPSNFRLIHCNCFIAKDVLIYEMFKPKETILAINL